MVVSTCFIRLVTVETWFSNNLLNLTRSRQGQGYNRLIYGWHLLLRHQFLDLLH